MNRIARCAGLLDKADGRLDELMEGEPQVFGMAFLCDEEGEKKYGKDAEQDGVDKAGKALEKSMGQPEIEN